MISIDPLIHHHTLFSCVTLKKGMVNIMGKEENVGISAFSSLRTTFSTLSMPIPLFGPQLALPNDKILDWSNLKAFADDKI